MLTEWSASRLIIEDVWCWKSNPFSIIFIIAINVLTQPALILNFITMRSFNQNYEKNSYWWSANGFGKLFPIYQYTFWPVPVRISFLIDLLWSTRFIVIIITSYSSIYLNEDHDYKWQGLIRAVVIRMRTNEVSKLLITWNSLNWEILAIPLWPSIERIDLEYPKNK